MFEPNVVMTGMEDRRGRAHHGVRRVIPAEARDGTRTQVVLA